MKKKRLLSLVMAVSLLFGTAAALPESVVTDSIGITASAVRVATSGKCGENVTWSLENGVLTISGTGEMKYYFNSPFKNRTEIETVVIKTGVTSVGARVFEDCTNITNITIPSSVSSILEVLLFVTVASSSPNNSFIAFLNSFNSFIDISSRYE